MASAYRLQIVDAAGAVVYAELPGLAAEVELIDNLAARVAAKGIGVGRSTAHVVSDLKVAFRELLHELKRPVPPPSVP